MRASRKLGAQKLADALRLELRSFPRKQVDRFVSNVWIALQAEAVLSQLPSETLRRKELRALKSAARRFAAALKKPTPIGAVPQRIDMELWTPSAAEKARVEDFASINTTLRAVLRDFQWHIDLALEECRPGRKGHPSADARGLLSRIAHRYVSCFGVRPSPTPGHDFSNIVILVMETVTGKRPENVSRLVKAATRSLRSRDVIRSVHDQ